MEEKKNNKGFVWVIVILIILVLGLVGYIVYDKVLLEDNNALNNGSTTTTTNKMIDNDKNVGDCYNIDSEKRCVLFKKDNIELTESRSDISHYYVNDNILFNGTGTECDVNSATVFDKNYLIIYCGADVLYPNIVDSNGRSPINFKEINEEGVFNSATFNDNILKLTRITYEPDYEAALCRGHMEVVAYEEYEIKYENNVFSEPKTINSKTAKEIIDERFNMTCEEIKTTTDPDMEYHKYLANGE